MTPEKVVEVQKYGREPISLHTPLGEDGDSEFGDLIEDSEAVVPADAVSFTLLQEQLHDVLDTLSEREAGVVSMRFGLTDGQPKTLDEIGKVYGVTRERIRQIESKTMSKLRHPSRSRCCGTTWTDAVLPGLPGLAGGHSSAPLRPGELEGPQLSVGWATRFQLIAAGISSWIFSGNLLQLVGVLLAVVGAEEKLEPAGQGDADVGLCATPITTVGGV